MTTADIIQAEDAYQLPTYSKAPMALVRGAGSWVWDADDRRFLDFYGGHCVTLLGHCPPRVVQAVQQQAATLLFYSNVNYSPVRAAAAAAIARLAPEGLGRVFFCNSGTEANETALKLARTFTGKSGMIATHGGFHGRTLGSLAVTHTPTYRAPYQAVLPDTHFVPFGDADAVAEVLAADDKVAAVILEPIQSMAGVITAAPAYFERLRDLTRQHGALLIFDEVQTGVGRTGTFSISEALGVTPDLITMAKSLGSGVPVGATLVADAVAATVQPGDQGTTFGGGMLAMAAVKATLDLLVEDNLMPRAGYVFDAVREAVAPHAVDVRGQGCLIGVELPVLAAPVATALRERGVLVGTSGHPHTLRLMPAITTADAEIAHFAEVFATVMRAAHVA